LSELIGGHMGKILKVSFSTRKISVRDVVGAQKSKVTRFFT